MNNSQAQLYSLITKNRHSKNYLYLLGTFIMEVAPLCNDDERVTNLCFEYADLSSDIVGTFYFMRKNRIALDEIRFYEFFFSRMDYQQKLDLLNLAYENLFDKFDRIRYLRNMLDQILIDELRHYIQDTEQFAIKHFQSKNKKVIINIDDRFQIYNTQAMINELGNYKQISVPPVTNSIFSKNELQLPYLLKDDNGQLNLSAYKMQFRDDDEVSVDTVSSKIEDVLSNQNSINEQENSLDQQVKQLMSGYYSSCKHRQITTKESFKMVSKLREIDFSSIPKLRAYNDACEEKLLSISINSADSQYPNYSPNDQMEIVHQ